LLKLVIGGELIVLFGLPGCQKPSGTKSPPEALQLVPVMDYAKTVEYNFFEGRGI
jgi:hypothetical protein